MSNLTTARDVFLTNKVYETLNSSENFNKFACPVKIKIVLHFLLIMTTILGCKNLAAQEVSDQLHQCSLYDAIYKPVGDSSSYTFGYTITFEDLKESELPSPSYPIFNVVLKAFDKETGNFLDQHEMPYMCSMGSLAVCSVQLSKELDIPLIRLEKDFSYPKNIQDSSEIVILPNFYTNAIFASRSPSADFLSKIEGLEHGGYKDRILSVPEIWKRYECIQNKERPK